MAHLPDMTLHPSDDRTPLPPLTIGSPVWIHDENRRVYNVDASGRSFGSPINREKFSPGVIVAETRVSWLVKAEGNEHKLPKKIRMRGVAYSSAEFEGAVYAADNVHAIAEMVRRTNPEILRKVADLVGYVPKVPVSKA